MQARPPRRIAVPPHLSRTVVLGISILLAACDDGGTGRPADASGDGQPADTHDSGAADATDLATSDGAIGDGPSIDGLDEPSPDAGGVDLLDAAPETGTADTGDVTPDTTSDADAAPAACNRVTSAGCPDNQKCTLNNVCGPFGAGEDNAICVSGGDADCARGFICISTSGGENDTSLCRRFCYEDEDCLEGSLCLQTTPSVPPLICTFAPHCDPFGEQCESSRGCYPALYNDGSFICLPDGRTGDGEACTTINQCRRGSVCVGAEPESPGTCRSLCDGGNPCSGGGACELLPDSAVGVCSE